MLKKMSQHISKCDLLKVLFSLSVYPVFVYIHRVSNYRGLSSAYIEEKIRKLEKVDDNNKYLKEKGFHIDQTLIFTPLFWNNINKFSLLLIPYILKYQTFSHLGPF